MLSYLLYHRSCSVTGRAMGAALGVRFKGSTPKRDRGVYDIVVRWGSSLEFPARFQLNPAVAIRKSADKLVTYNCLSEAGVSVVPYTTVMQEAREWGTSIYGRQRHGSGGKDIVIYGPQDFPFGHSVYTQGINIHREYRIHVVGDTIIRVQGKYLDIPEDDKQNGQVCNHANGYRFKTPQQTLNQSRLDDAIKAVKALGLDFGAVDLITGTDKKHYVLEVNTGPACSPKTLEAYRAALVPLIQERVNG